MAPVSVFQVAMLNFTDEKKAMRFLEPSLRSFFKPRFTSYGGDMNLYSSRCTEYLMQQQNRTLSLSLYASRVPDLRRSYSMRSFFQNCRGGTRFRLLLLGPKILSSSAFSAVTLSNSFATSFSSKYQVEVKTK